MDHTIASTGSPDSSRLLRAEIRDYFHARDERRRILPRAALVGLLSGFVAVAFRLALDGGQWVRDQLGVYDHHVRIVGPLLLPLFCCMMAMLSVLLVRRFAPETAGSGIPHLEAVLPRFRSLIWERVLPIKFMGGALPVGLAGMALGREGPTLTENGIDMPFPTQQVVCHDQTEETDGNRRQQREGWPAGNSQPPRPRPVATRVELQEATSAGAAQTARNGHE